MQNTHIFKGNSSRNQCNPLHPPLNKIEDKDKSMTDASFILRHAKSWFNVPWEVATLESY